MGKTKKDKKQKDSPAVAPGAEPELARLREENKDLRERLAKIAGLAQHAPAFEADKDEEDEYEELTNDVDDLIDGSELETQKNDGQF